MLPKMTTIKKGPHTKSEHAWLKRKQAEHRRHGMTRAEKWFYEKLTLETIQGWTYQAIWGWRLYDFWSAELGVAVEVDGPEHDPVYDFLRDLHDYETSGVFVFRVRNFDEGDAKATIDRIGQCDSWMDRRAKLCLLTETQKRRV